LHGIYGRKKSLSTSLGTPPGVPESLKAALGCAKTVARVEQMIEEGADIIDLGGESTRPGLAQSVQKKNSSELFPS
jgi:dihydropteroate synthase